MGNDVKLLCEKYNQKQRIFQLLEVNALEYTIKNGKKEYYEHLLPIQGIVDYYSSNAEDDVDYDTAIYQLLYTLFVHSSDDKLVDKILQSLNISNEIIKKY